MKKIISSLMMITTMTMFAQKPYVVTSGSEIELQSKSNIDNIVPYGADDVCMVSIRNVGIMQRKTENISLNLFKGITFQKSINLKTTEENSYYLESYNNDEKLCYIDMIYDLKKKTARLFYRGIDNSINISKSTLINDVYGDYKTIQSPNMKKILNIGLYTNNEAKQKITVCYDGKTSMFFKPNSIKIGVVDENGDLFFNKDIIINAPAECDKISIEDYKINDAGDVFLMVKQYIKGKKEQTTGEANYKLYILAITDKGISSKKYAIDIKEYFCKRPGLVISNTGNVYCAGFLSEKVSGNFAGIFTQKLGADLDATQYKINKISSEDILKYNSKFKIKDNEISQNFVINYIVEIGNELHISSEYHNAVKMPTSSGATISILQCYDILYFVLDNTLNLKEIFSIPKYQKTTGFDMFLGYKLIFHNNKPYFIFNDSKMNIDKKDDEKLNVAVHLKDYVAVIVYYNGTSWIREQMFEEEKGSTKGNYVLIVNAVHQIDENNILLPFNKGIYFSLKKLTFAQ